MFTNHFQVLSDHLAKIPPQDDDAWRAIVQAALPTLIFHEQDLWFIIGQRAKAVPHKWFMCCVLTRTFKRILDQYGMYGCNKAPTWILGLSVSHVTVAQDTFHCYRLECSRLAIREHSQSRSFHAITKRSQRANLEGRVKLNAPKSQLRSPDE